MKINSRLERPESWTLFGTKISTTLQWVLNLATIAILGYICVKTWQDGFNVGMDKPAIYSAFAIGFQVVYTIFTGIFYYQKYELYRAPFYSYIFLNIVTILPYALVLGWFKSSTLQGLKDMSAVNWRINVAFMEFEDKHKCIGYVHGGDDPDYKQNNRIQCDKLFDDDMESYFNNYKLLFIVSFVLNVISILHNGGFQLFRRIFKCIDFNVQL